MEHYTLIRDYFSRQPRLSPAGARSVAGALAADLARLLEVPPEEIGEPATFLAGLIQAFERSHRYYDVADSGRAERPG